MKLRLHNRFIHVGVDISSYALLAGGRSPYPPVLVKLLYSRVTLILWFSGYSYWSVILCTLVLPSARPCAVRDDNNKSNVCTPSIPAGLKCPPLIHDHLTISWFEAYLNNEVFTELRIYLCEYISRYMALSWSEHTRSPPPLAV